MQSVLDHKKAKPQTFSKRHPLRYTPDQVAKEPMLTLVAPQVSPHSCSGGLADSVAASRASSCGLTVSRPVICRGSFPQLSRNLGEPAALSNLAGDATTIVRVQMSRCDDFFN